MHKNQKEHNHVISSLIGWLFEVILYFPRLIAHFIKAIF